MPPIAECVAHLPSLCTFIHSILIPPCVCWLQVLTLLLFARVWAMALDLILPLGFLFLLLSTVPQFVSYLNLVKRLDDPDNSSITLAQVLVPNAVSWFAMWCSSLVIAYGLRQKERMRDQLMATGAVWTYHEGVRGARWREV